jgi:mono/diheme cytochrome c family protein
MQARHITTFVRDAARFSIIILLLTAACYGTQPQAVASSISPPYTPAESGQEMFNAYCASCHGTDGRGSGPTAASLKTRPSDLTQLARHNHGVFPSAAVTSTIQHGTNPAHGSSEMPVWGPGLNRVSGHDEEVTRLRIQNLVTFIESLQKKNK